MEMNDGRTVSGLLVVASMLVSSGRDAAASEVVRLTVPGRRLTYSADGSAFGPAAATLTEQLQMICERTACDQRPT